MEDDVLRWAAAEAAHFLDTVPERRVGAAASADDLRAALGGELPEQGEDPRAALGRLVAGVEPGLVATPGPRYFGFVVGGALPQTVASQWLAAAWDQNAFSYVLSPAASVIEEVAASWLLDVLGLPSSASVGFVTGAMMANFTCLAAARHAVLADAGWDVEARGLYGAPEITVIVGGDAHTTLFAALRYLGLGAERVIRVEADDQGRMRPDLLEGALGASAGPTIVCAQVGNVNSGACDPIGAISALTRPHGAWLHVDGAFGAWAAAAPARRHLVAGIELADSWSVDGHKWLNVPQDAGYAIVAHPDAHLASMTIKAAYLQRADEGRRDPGDWVPESSRRARGFDTWVALRTLGRSGVAELVERRCQLARRMADRLAAEPGVVVLNDVVLNQVLVRFTAGDDPDDGDARTEATVAAVQDDGTCWLGGTRWRGQSAMRIAVSNWSTTEADIDRSAEAIIRCAREVAAGGPQRGSIGFSIAAPAMVTPSGIGMSTRSRILNP
jgi:glutamate/tyrosine decarboxylase-like PLP-dependent enzyme